MIALVCFLSGVLTTQLGHQTHSIAVSSDAQISMVEPAHHQVREHVASQDQDISTHSFPSFAQESQEMSTQTAGILDKLKNLGKGVTKNINDVKPMIMQAYTTYTMGVAKIAENDFPFACLCHSDGFCMTTRALDPEDSSTKDKNGKCRGNAGNAPDPNMKDEASFPVLYIFAGTPIVGLLLMCCVKAASDEKPDLLPNFSSD